MSAVESRRAIDDALRGATKAVIDNALDQIERAADRQGADPSGHHAALAYLNWVTKHVEHWREVVIECIEEPPDVTGNPWPDCICNDARYELGHMESCPAYGRTPDAPE